MNNEIQRFEFPRFSVPAHPVELLKYAGNRQGARRQRLILPHPPATRMGTISFASHSDKQSNSGKLNVYRISTFTGWQRWNIP